MNSTQARTSQVNAVFDRVLSELLEEFLTAMRKHKLCNPGILRSYPQTPFRELGLAAVTAVDSASGCFVSLSSTVLSRLASIDTHTADTLFPISAAPVVAIGTAAVDRDGLTRLPCVSETMDEGAMDPQD